MTLEHFLKLSLFCLVFLYKIVIIKPTGYIWLSAVVNCGSLFVIGK